MKKYTATLLESINNSVVYEGGPVMGIENVSKMDQSSKFIEMIEDSLLPIRQDGWFREGVKKTRKTRHLIVHHPNLLSHTYLQSHPEGVLHVLPGWTRKLLISDIAYRFESSGTTQYRTAVPFLGGLHCTVKTYNCAGVMVCKRCSSEFRERGRHIVLHPNDSNVLDCAEDLSPAAEARKKFIGLYMGMEAKRKTRTGFCQAEVRETLGGPIVKCRGGPVVRPSKSKPGTFFTGFSGYSIQESHTPKMKRNRMRNLHYACGISFEGPMLQLYRDFLSGKERPSAHDESSCTFVRGKYKSRVRCPRHGCELVHLSCKVRPGDKHSSHSMSVIEPNGYHEDTPDDKKVLYVSCIGEHRHPAPPPVEATAMKQRVFDFLCAQRKWKSLAQLRKMIALALEKVEQTENGKIQLFDGTLTIPCAVSQRRLRMLRPPVPKLAVEVGELAMMAADEGNHYVRGMKIVGEKYVVFLALDELLAFASHQMSFAGDATFKIVTEETRTVTEVRWYLYNIVTHASKDRLYLPVPSVMNSRCCDVVAITMDFDTAEVLGCAEALMRMCGGTVLMHLLGMFIGCSVHLDPDLIRRSKDERVQERSRKRLEDLLSLYHKVRDAESQTAKLCLEEIKVLMMDGYVGRKGMA